MLRIKLIIFAMEIKLDIKTVTYKNKMKKAILFLLLTAIVSTIYSQEMVDVKTFHRIVYERVYENGQFVSKVKSESSFDVNYKMVIDLKSNRIIIDNVAATAFYIVSRESSIKDVDEDGDVRLTTIFKGYDEEEIRCYAELIVYEKLPYVFFTLSYSDVKYSFIGTLSK